MPKNKIRLSSIDEHIKKIKNWIKGISLEEFLKDEKLVQAVILSIILIGEDINKVDFEILLKSNPNEKYWRGIIGARNLFVHSYDTIDEEEVYKIATRDICELEKYIEKILKSD